jgi:hypothetical protein
MTLRCEGGEVHLPQQLPRDRLAGNPDRRWPSRVLDHRLRPAAGGLPLLHRRGRHVVGPGVGPLPVHRGLGSPLHLRVRRLRRWPTRVQRCQWRPAGDAGRVHPRRRRPQNRLLRREQRRRVQPSRGDQTGRWRAVPERVVPGGHQPRVPDRAGGAIDSAAVSDERHRRRRGGGVQECVPGVRDGRVLLPRAVRVAGDVQAERILEDVQGAVPAGVQLRIRRREQHLHLQRHGGLPGHLLPRLQQHRNEEAGHATATPRQQDLVGYMQPS